MPYAGTNDPRLSDAAWLRQRYELEQRTMGEIADEVGCTPAAVLYQLRKHNIPRRTAGQTRVARGTSSRRRFWQLGDADWLRLRYIDKVLTTEEIAAEIGCSHAAVGKALRTLNISARTSGRMRNGKLRSDRIPQLHDSPDWLTNERLIRHRTVDDIAAELKCKPQTVTTWLKRWGIRWKEPLPRGIQLLNAKPRLQKHASGYVFAWAPDHPAASARGFVPYHRVVAEQALGRLLGPREVVHHLNINPSDNRIENLMVFQSNGDHMSFHANPPAWVPRCKCCGKPNPEVLTGRPPDVPLLYAA